MNDWHHTSLAISSSLDPGLGVLDVTYAKASYKVLQRAMHIHPTSSRNSFRPCSMISDRRKRACGPMRPARVPFARRRSQRSAGYLQPSGNSFA
jgi:hypothetical protein